MSKKYILKIVYKKKLYYNFKGYKIRQCEM